jgi:hypothetical protein
MANSYYLNSNAGIGRFRWLRCLPAVFATLCVIVVTPSTGQDGKAAPAVTHVDGELFDGKSLEGWKKTDFYGSGDVKVETGMVVMSAGRSMTGITSTRSDLPTTNYELSYEAMRIGGRDFFAAATFPVGTSFITLVNGGWGGSMTGLSSLDGMDASENETTRSIRYQDKTWYAFRVRVTGKMIRCSIDGKEILAVNYQDRRVGTRIECRHSQPLGFATWETTGAVRNVKIRKLTAEEIAAADKFEE